MYKPSIASMFSSKRDAAEPLRRQSSSEMTEVGSSSPSASSFSSPTIVVKPPYGPIHSAADSVSHPIILHTPPRTCYRGHSSVQSLSSNTVQTPLLYANDRDVSHRQRVAAWLRDIVGLPQYVAVFFEHGFDRMAFIENMNESDLIDMKIQKTGHKKRILQQIKVYIKQQQPRQRVPGCLQQSKSVSHTIDIAKSFGMKQKIPPRPQALSAHHLKAVPSSESVLSQSPTFNSSDLYVADENADHLDLYETKDGESMENEYVWPQYKANQNAITSQSARMLCEQERHAHSSPSRIAIHGSLDDGALDAFPQQRSERVRHGRARNKRRFRHRNMSNGSRQQSETSLSSMASYMSLDEHVGPNRPATTSFDGVRNPTTVMNTVSIQSAMKAAQLTLEENHEEAVNGGDEMEHEDNCQHMVMDSLFSDIPIGDLNANGSPQLHKSTLSSSISGIWNAVEGDEPGTLQTATNQ
eukprot:CAMPEP_0197074676 /NCGR_PEP_ID=MMETSP1384-20130603/211227_1 /TAXON_ID=29189 /ORGANISM="Ammonia sp." /LENGTH=467 /DNA_ID=CAMNT_0042513517 /DNA_START=82 /DNA_END=1485 /DNA_ORIENTATION=-